MKSIDKHKKIIRAATKVFAKKGFFNARISDIAKEAKIADGTIYLYFKNKFDILISVFEQEMGKLIDQIADLLAEETDPQKKLDIFILNHLEELKKNRNLADVIHVELRQTHKLIRDYRKNVFSNYLNIVAGIIREGQEKGIYRQDVNPDVAKFLLFGALDEITRVTGNNSEIEESLTPAELAEQLTTIFIKGIIAEPDKE